MESFKLSIKAKPIFSTFILVVFVWPHLLFFFRKIFLLCDCVTLYVYGAGQRVKMTKNLFLMPSQDIPIALPYTSTHMFDDSTFLF